MQGRFAPSPTGVLHLGNLRTALAAWASARSQGGAFTVRMEDLDPITSRREYEQRQLDDLAAIGIDHDGEVVRQSERFHLHRAAIDRLRDLGVVYPCYCTRREIREAASAPHRDAQHRDAQPDGAYPGTCRTLTDARRRELERDGRRPALRLRSDGECIPVDDVVAGRFEGVVDDVVLQRNDGVPAYNLAVVVDDELQGVTEVVRADDLLSSTPRQVHLQRLLGYSTPVYAHVPLVVTPDGVRLAKRHGAVTLEGAAEHGLDAAAVRTLLAHSLGMASIDDRSTPADLVAAFAWGTVPCAPWVPPVDLLRSS